MACLIHHEAYVEKRALGWVEPLDGADEPDIALFDEVGKREAATGVVLGDGDDEA